MTWDLNLCGLKYFSPQAMMEILQLGSFAIAPSAMMDTPALIGKSSERS
jgi:hypothetical protein